MLVPGIVKPAQRPVLNATPLLIEVPGIVKPESLQPIAFLPRTPAARDQIGVLWP